MCWVVLLDVLTFCFSFVGACWLLVLGTLLFGFGYVAELNVLFDYV